jgi:hypothetical protein
MDDSEQPFVVERPNTPGRGGKVRLNAGAKFWARENNMSEEQMAAHLLYQADLRARGLTQKVGEN